MVWMRRICSLLMIVKQNDGYMRFHHAKFLFFFVFDIFSTIKTILKNPIITGFLVLFRLFII